MVNTMLHKTPTIELTNPYLAINDNVQYNTNPIHMDIMKCLVSKEHYCSLSGGLYLVNRHTDCALALYITKQCHVIYTLYSECHNF